MLGLFRQSGESFGVKISKWEPFETCFVDETKTVDEITNKSNHIAEKSNVIAQVCCRLCKRLSNLRRALLKHIHDHHPDDSLTVESCCNLCFAGKILQSEILSHLMSLSAEKLSTTSETCDECTSKTGPSQFALCFEGSNHQRLLSNHFEVEHSDDLILYNECNIAMTSCFCPKGLLIQRNFVNHLLNCSADLIGIDEIKREDLLNDYEASQEKPVKVIEQSHLRVFGNRSFEGDETFYSSKKHRDAARDSSDPSRMLSQHVAQKPRNHPGDNDFKREDKHYKCKLCSYVGYHKQRYRMHWENAHDPSNQNSRANLRINERSEKHPADSECKREINNRYICQLCSFSCFHRKRYRMHWEAAHDPLNLNPRNLQRAKLRSKHLAFFTVENGRCVCCLCPYNCKKRESYRKHWDTYHDASNPQPRFRNLKLTEVHPGDVDIKLDALTSQYNCQLCPFVNNNKLRSRRHWDLEHDPTNTHECAEPTCANRFRSSEEANKHNREKHNDVENVTLQDSLRETSSILRSRQRKGFECDVCGLKAYTRSLIKLHIEKNHSAYMQSSGQNEANQFVCEEPGCNRFYANKVSLRNHRKYLHSKVICDQCAKSVPAMSLSRHMQRHHDHKKAFSCEFPGCKSSFIEKYNLTLHMRRHTGEKPFQCEFCSMSFPRKQPLELHRIKHTDPERLRCKVCQALLTTTAGFRYHMRNHETDSEVRRHFCDHPGCGKSFKFPDYLRSHVLYSHTEEGRMKRRENGIKLADYRRDYGKEYYRKNKDKWLRR